jgi:hypothetical protein
MHALTIEPCVQSDAAAVRQELCSGCTGVYTFQELLAALLRAVSPQSPLLLCCAPDSIHEGVSLGLLDGVRVRDSREVFRAEAC